jgi:hypothetical protein
MSKGEEKAAKPARVVAMPARKAFMEERKRRAAMPTKERPKETRPSTVKGKIASINDQMKTNVAAIADFNANVGVFYEATLAHVKKHKEAISAFNASVREQMNENTEAAAAISSGARNIQSSINDQIQENMEYVKTFYG